MSRTMSVLVTTNWSPPLGADWDIMVASYQSDTVARCPLYLSFPKIISGCIGDVALPRQESRQRHQTVGLLDARAHLFVMPSACALDCNTPHRRKEIGAGAPRRRLEFGPGTRDAMCRSDVPQSHFATAIHTRSADRGYP